MRNSREQKQVYRDLLEEIEESEPSVEESIEHAYLLGLLSVPQYERLKNIANGGDGDFD